MLGNFVGGCLTYSLFLHGSRPLAQKGGTCLALFEKLFSFPLDQIFSGLFFASCAAKSGQHNILNSTTGVSPATS